MSYELWWCASTPFFSLTTFDGIGMLRLDWIDLVEMDTITLSLMFHYISVNALCDLHRVDGQFYIISLINHRLLNLNVNRLSHSSLNPILP